MSALGFINYFFVQWFCIRICKSIDIESKRVTGYGILYFVVPLTGWNNEYKEIGIFKSKIIIGR